MFAASKKECDLGVVPEILLTPLPDFQNTDMPITGLLWKEGRLGRSPRSGFVQRCPSWHRQPKPPPRIPGPPRDDPLPVLALLRDVSLVGTTAERAPKRDQKSISLLDKPAQSRQQRVFGLFAEDEDEGLDLAVLGLRRELPVEEAL